MKRSEQDRSRPVIIVLEAMSGKTIRALKELFEQTKIDGVRLTQKPHVQEVKGMK